MDNCQGLQEAKCGISDWHLKDWSDWSDFLQIPQNLQRFRDTNTSRELNSLNNHARQVFNYFGRTAFCESLPGDIYHKIQLDFMTSKWEKRNWGQNTFDFLSWNISDWSFDLNIFFCVRVKEKEKKEQKEIDT